MSQKFLLSSIHVRHLPSFGPCKSSKLFEAANFRRQKKNYEPSRPRCCLRKQKKMPSVPITRTVPLASQEGRLSCEQLCYHPCLWKEAQLKPQKAANSCTAFKVVKIRRKPRSVQGTSTVCVEGIATVIAALANEAKNWVLDYIVCKWKLACQESYGL